MMFPSSGNGRPYARIDGRSGAWALSVPDGDPEVAEMKGKVLDIDLGRARQGWLRLDANGADFQPLAEPDVWTGTPKPSPDYKAAVEIDVAAPTWPEPRVRQLRSSSRCVTSFIARVAEAAGEVPEDRAVRIKVTGARVVRIGKGSSAEISFDVAPQEKWPPRDFFDAANAEVEAAKPAEPAASDAAAAFDDMADDADEWS